MRNPKGLVKWVIVLIIGVISLGLLPNWVFSKDKSDEGCKIIAELLISDNACPTGYAIGYTEVCLSLDACLHLQEACPDYNVDCSIDLLNNEDFALSKYLIKC